MAGSSGGSMSRDWERFGCLGFREGGETRSPEAGKDQGRRVEHSTMRAMLSYCDGPGCRPKHDTPNQDVSTKPNYSVVPRLDQ